MKKNQDAILRSNLKILAGLRPLEFWKHFNRLCITPRNSNEEGEIAELICNMAGAYGREFTKDKRNNVLVQIPASSKFQHFPVRCLQAHIDMVCIKDKNIEDVFPVELLPVSETGILTANGTTLGADNGAGVAAMMMLITDSSIEHGPLELLFTTAEEVGLDGANEFDYTQLKATQIINLDSEEEGMFFVGCAGGGRVEALMGFLKQPSLGMNGLNKYSIEISGLSGGHSGMEIHLGRANAIKELARILSEVNPENFLLCGFSGGEKMNAIPINGKAEFLYPARKTAELINALNGAIQKIQQRFPSEKIKISLTKITSGDKSYITPEVASNLFKLLNDLPDGVIAMEPGSKTMTQTSNNVAIVDMQENVFKITCMYRSSLMASLTDVENNIVELFKKAAANTTLGSKYFPWEPQFGTKLLETAQNAFETLFAAKAEEVTIHAGLESAVFYQKKPGAEIISFGPSMGDVHTTKEWVDINSVERFVKLLKVILITP